MSVTYFVAPLRCPVCGRISPADTSTHMSSNLLPEPGTHIVRVGDRLPIQIDEVEDAYLQLRAPRRDEPIVILEKWLCPYDGVENWARIVLENWVIAEISAVDLTQETVRQAHFISFWIEEWLQDRYKTTLFDGAKLRIGYVDVLIGVLPPQTANG